MKPGKSDNREIRQGTAIDIIAMAGALAFRLRENPGEPIYVLTTDEADRFITAMTEMNRNAKLMAQAGQHLPGSELTM